MNEAETRAENIDPKLKEDGWDNKTDPDVVIRREYSITKGKLKSSGGREKALIVDYLLGYKNRNLAVIEAKSISKNVSEGVAQAKNYAEKLKLDNAYSANGKEIYYIDMDAGKEGEVDKFHSPQELLNKSCPELNSWQKSFDISPFERKGDSREGRYYQEIAVESVMDAIAYNQKRILLTLATGTGKTFIAFQIAWKLFQSRWNLQYDGKRRPHILFLTDRNLLANQAFNEFSFFPQDALIRIKPDEIKKRKKVPTNGAVFFTIFQTFMSGPDDSPYFGNYPKDFFDFIVVDECHRGGARDESTWRAILEYFSPAVQLGMTATPRREVNRDTYLYFGKPVFVYSLIEGIKDGFLTPYKVRHIKTTLDTYKYDSEDKVIEGEIDEKKKYLEEDFNRIIHIKAREEKRVQIFMDMINQKEKTLVFCRTQEHAAIVRDLINQYKNSTEPNYCVRVTANDGELGEQYLREFQDNEKTIPTILTTSQKLSTGVDARNIRNIILLRAVENIVEFKQIIGRGTRLFDGKFFFTIYDFVGATKKFSDPEWDGEPEDPELCDICNKYPCECEKQPPKECPRCGKIPCVCLVDPPQVCEKCGEYPCVCKKMIKIKLKDGRELEIQHTVESTFWGPDGEQLSVEEFLNLLYGRLPEFFSTEEELRKLWSVPSTRNALLTELEENGINNEDLKALQKIINAENSDLFDVLEFIAFHKKPISRETRVKVAEAKMYYGLNDEQIEFVEFVISKYLETGVDELSQDKLSTLLELKYKAIGNAHTKLGETKSIINLFIDFQKHLYDNTITSKVV